VKRLGNSGLHGVPRLDLVDKPPLEARHESRTPRIPT
jgi:hypothetical protein